MRKVTVVMSLLLACTNGGELPGETIGGERFVQEGSPEEAAVLAAVNDREVTLGMLDDDAGLDRRAAEGIIRYRNGTDAIEGTADDVDYQTIDEVDAISYVGPSALAKLLEFAIAQGYGSAPDPEVSDREATILAVVNDRSVTFEVLDDDVGLDRRAAGNIIEYRSGDDGLLDTADDVTFRNVAELDAVSFVGNSALEAIFQWGLDNGFGAVGSDDASAIFSPQPFATSHAARAIELMDGAEHSLDIAMYSWSLGSVYDAVERAVDRGIAVRVIFETANADRRKDGDAFENSRSARLERMGINVRWVNKIMHHKFVIVDGPRDDASRADTCTLASGSGNWSNGGATRYDENTLFLTGVSELCNAFQREFDHLWNHSRDFVYDETLPYELATNIIDPATIDQDPDVHVYMTSDNFNVSEGSDTFRINWGNTVSDALVDAIERAETSIHVASGHLRSRPVSEALLAKAAANPDMDIRVYLDGQEWISDWYHNRQLENLDECLANANTASQTRRCYDRGFMFGYELGQAGIAVRYKYYSYRWHYTYAVQMHHKLMIIDGDELWTGSYNLSDNAEHNTFENMVMLRGARFSNVVAAYEENFESLWETNRANGALADLMTEVATEDVIPLVFTPMALEWDEVDGLKDLIRDNCPDINSEPFRTRPENHRICRR
ncbi:MAG: phospholipase D-like domain-containing protein [Myxococcota bacterium]